MEVDGNPASRTEPGSGPGPAPGTLYYIIMILSKRIRTEAPERAA